MRTHKELLDAGIRSGHEYLESFKELGPGWDGYAGVPIQSKAIVLAHMIMDIIGTDKFVCPDSAEGGVEFEWDVDDEGHNLGLVKENSGTYMVTILYLPKDIVPGLPSPEAP